MFRQLDYQDRVLAILDAYIDVLKDGKAACRQGSCFGRAGP